ncbi:MAG: S8 family serine peptidase [Anaerolineae bacterium]|nr:S8 family serine peptidase [Anaerolineae bacterium]
MICSTWARVNRRMHKMRSDQTATLLKGALLIGLIALLVMPANAQSIDLDTLLVKLPLTASGTSDTSTASKVLSRYDLKRLEPLHVPGWFRIQAAANILDRLQEQLQCDPNILAVERDGVVQATIIPNDTYWSSQWGPLKIGAPGAWEITTGSSAVIIAIVDSGIDTDHPDLINQLWINSGETPGDGIDNDGNGFIDDIYGWRFLDTGQNNNVEDDLGHGTHVAGIAGAMSNNDAGIAGMAWGSKLMILKMLDYRNSGRYSDLADAIIYAADNGARVINLSLGSASGAQVMEDAVNYATGHGALVVAAAGNNSSSVYYPGAYPAALAVAATDSNDQHASYSNSGPEVDIAAPGSGIYSTCTLAYYPYCYKSGTSMATPHVAGLAALLWSQHYTYTVGQVRQFIINNTVDVESPGWDSYTGWGRIDAWQALTATLEPQTLYIYYFPLIMIGEVD